MMKRLKLPNLTDATSRRIIIVILMVVTMTVFAQVRQHQFLNFDDDVYVTKNTHIADGISWANIRWAFTSTYANNWHPVTWLSHMTDVELFGLDAGKHHLTSVLFHFFNTLLLFFVLMKMTGNLYPSGVVAALFAVHPLHVESVAWIAERKDVLSTFFAFLTIGAYWWYSNRPSVGRYLPVAVLFALGLMAKPMLVTLPFILLLLDWWPLNRFGSYPTGKKWFLFLEKAPLIACSIISGVITYLAQQQAVRPFEEFPLPSRILNALIAYMDYLRQTFWPHNMAVFYPCSLGAISLWKAGLAGFLLVFITILALMSRKRGPYFTMGWFWYLGTLVPVIGIVQVGGQARADRYTYIPLIGIFIAVVWLISAISVKWKPRKYFLFAAAVTLILFFSATAKKQVSYWHDNITLYNHTLEAAPNNYIACYNLGAVYSDLGLNEKAMDFFKKAIEANPNFSGSYYNLGCSLHRLNRFEEAIKFFKLAIKINPQFADAYYNLATAYLLTGRIQESRKAFAKVRELERQSGKR